MSEVKRCPSCGAQNAATAEWCTLCLTRFDGAVIRPQPPQPEEDATALEPAGPQEVPPAGEAPGSAAVHAAITPPPPPPVAQAPVRFIREGDRVRWVCPSCDTVNDIESGSCRICGTVMARLFAPEEPTKEKKTRKRSATVALSAVLPGLGHVAEGSAPTGVSRALLYLWTVGISILLITRAPVKGRGVVQAVGIVFAAAAAGIWLVSLAESYRLASGDATPLVKPRIITWLFTGLTLALFLGVLVAAAAGRS